MIFLSTLSLRRATRCCQGRQRGRSISIHALLAESDGIGAFIVDSGIQFLSTLSLRRATSHFHAVQKWYLHFYPRSPCGERLHLFASSGVDFAISIHALLAESDAGLIFFLDDVSLFLSTLSLRRATVHYDNYNLHCVISIHALLAESDVVMEATKIENQ